jgi:hypothetical protein
VCCHKHIGFIATRVYMLLSDINKLFQVFILPSSREIEVIIIFRHFGSSKSSLGRNVVKEETA